MEIWDIYDRNRNKTGRTMVSGSEFGPEDYILVVHVCIFNSDGKMLIQQRQLFKEGWPGKWDVTVGGRAITSDDSKTAAEREVFEEIGHKISLEGIIPALTINFKYGFDDFYLIEEDIEIDELILQYKEVKQIKWASEEEVMEIIDRNEFIPFHKSLIQFLFDMHGNGDALKEL